MRRIPHRLALAAIVFCLGLCISGSSLAAEPLRIGVLPVVDTLPLQVALERKHFESQKLPVELIVFQSALERDAAMMAGRLDGFFGDMLNSIMSIHSGQDLGVITQVFRTLPEQAMFGLLAAPSSSISGVNDLKGRKTAVSKSTIIEYILDRMMKSKGLPADFVEKTEIQKIPIRLQMLLAGQIDSAVLPEPLLTLAEAQGARRMLDDRNLDMCLTVLGLKRELSVRAPDLIARFLNAYAAAVTEVNRDPEVFRDLLVQKTGLPATIRNKFQIPAFPVPGLPLEKDIMDVQAWMKLRGMIGSISPADRFVIK